jgi:S1-C subfamily serine protease
MNQQQPSALVDLSNAIATVVAESRAYTVTVHGRRRLPGTGIVWADDLIVTANHIVEQDDGIEISPGSGERRSAAVVGRDPAGDIAVLRVSADDSLTSAPRASAEVRAGEIALGIGRAGSGHPEVSLGLINTTAAALRVSRGRIIEPVIQSEIVMLPGFSGGPLLNANGEVLGLNSSHLGRGTSLTISVAALAPIVETLTTHGRLRRGYLGIGAQAVGLSPSQISESGVDAQIGLVILSIDEGGPAHQAGLLIGDILIAVNGVPVRSVDDLVDQLPSELIGSSIPVVVVRGSQKQEIAITVGERG